MSLYQEYLSKKPEDDPNKINANEKSSLAANNKKVPDPISQSKEEDQRKEFLKIVDGKQDEKTDKATEEYPYSKDNQPNLPPVPHAPAKEQKLWARILAVCLISAGSVALSALLWYWAIKTPKIVTDIVIQEIEVIKVVPEVEPAFSFFSYGQFQDISITREEEISVYLKQHLANDYENDQLIKVSIRDYRDKINPQYITLKSFFEALKINPPREMYDKIIDEDFNLFIYSGEQNDIGFAFPVMEDSMTELLGIVLANWDETMDRDLTNFYSLVNPRGGEIAVPSTVYRRANIRCRGFRSAHHVCFTPLDDILIITTSLESAKAVVDRSQ